MANKKLLEEKAIRQFMKIAGTGALVDKFIKKTLKEENRGERTFDPHEEDSRFDNLKEEKESEEEEEKEEEDELDEELETEGEVKEESQESSAGSKKRIASGTPVKGAGKPGKMAFENQESSGGSKKRIASGTPVKGAGKPGKLQFEGEQLDEMGLPGEEDEMEMGSEQPPMGDEPEQPSMDDGGMDISGLVKAIAAAIETATGVKVSVEGGDEGGEGEEEMDMPPPDDESELPPPDDSLAEDGTVQYHPSDDQSKLPSGRMSEGKKAKSPSKDELVEAITRNVISKLTQASKKKTPLAKAPVKKK